jgi:hypothetical protein
MIQTWLPLPDYQESVRALRIEELGIQRLHVLELMEFIHEVHEDSSQLPQNYKRNFTGDDYQDAVNKGSDFPMVWSMWKGFELQLCEYGLTCCDEWQQRRSKRDPMYDKIEFHMECATTEDADGSKPNWFGDVDFHLSHQAALVRLDPKHYASYFRVDTDRELEWPVSRYVS